MATDRSPTARARACRSEVRRRQPTKCTQAARSAPTVKGATGGLIINKDLTYTAATGQEDLTINIPLISYDNFTFNGVANSDLRLRFPAGHRGTINFDGAGNEVEISENEGIGGTLGDERHGHEYALSFTARIPNRNSTRARVVFNKAGTIDHRGDVDGLQGIGNLVANAPVTIDLTKTFPVAGPQTDERTLEITRNLSGSAPITVQGIRLAFTGTGQHAESIANWHDAPPSLPMFLKWTILGR